MAYAAVASLVQTLEYLLQFTYMILEIKKMQAEVVKSKFDSVLLLLSGEPSSPSLLVLQQLRTQIIAQASAVEDFIGAVGPDADILEIKKRILSLSCGTIWLEEKPEILKEMRLF